MSDTHTSTKITDESVSAPNVMQSDKPSGRPASHPSGQLETPFVSLRNDGKLFPPDNMSSDAITKQQMDALHDQMKRFKANNIRHAEIKARLMAKQAEPPFYPHRGLFFLGPQNASDGMIGVNLKDIGPTSRVGGAAPFYMDVPFMQFIREKYVKSTLTKEKKNGPSDGGSQDLAPFSNLMILQRQLRSEIVAKKQPALSYSYSTPHFPVDSNGVKLQPADMFYRSRKQNKREWKQIEKDLKKKKSDKEEARRKIAGAFARAVVVHRDEFQRFHRHKRTVASRTAKAVKAWLENMEMRKEKADNREEARRLQALKENNMEAYVALVQETKNSRLKYLLSQTDEYISIINRLVKDQRSTGKKRRGRKKKKKKPATGTETEGDGNDMEEGEVEFDEGEEDNKDQQDEFDDDEEEGEEEEEEGESNRKSSLPPVDGSKGSVLSKEYYQDTHRHYEKVVQPRMLHGGDLKEYQLTGLQWLVSLYNNKLNGILADEMGLGKTIQALALLAYIMEFKHNNGPFLVVVPLTTLPNWINECNKWAPSMIKVVYRGAPTVRRAIYKEEVEPGKFNTLFTTYEYIMKDRSLLRRVDWQYIIVDEGHRMKNAQSKFAQTLGTAYHSKHRLLLTGTPLQNNLPELWALLNFLLPTIFNSVETFDQWFNQPFASFKSQSTGGEDGEGDMAQLTQEERLLIVNRLHEVLRPFMLRRVKDQVLDQLPEKTETILRCDMSGWQRKLYSLIHQKTLSTVKDAVGNVSNVYSSGLNNVLMQLRKICNHPYLFLADWPVDEDMIRASGKFELLDRMLPKLKAAGHRVLMFSQMTQAMTIMERFFELRGFPCLRLDGSTLPEERERRMVMFNDPDSPYFIFLLSTRAGGLGLNLATADVVIFFDSDWNPMMDAQAQDRAHRIGQRNEVRVFRLITTSVIEEKIIARATDKRNLTGLVVEAGKFNQSKGEKDGGGDENDRKAMMEALLKEYSEGLDFEEEGGDSEETAVPDNTMINDMMACNEAEFALYQKMDKDREERLKITAPGVPALIPANNVPQWARSPEMWLNRHQQLFAMAEQSDKMSLQKGVRGSASSTIGGGLKTDGQGEDGESVADGDEENMDDSALIALEERRKRKRKSVSYSDGMSDAQFISMVERTGREDEEALAASRALRATKDAGTISGAGGTPITPEIQKQLTKLLTDISKIKTVDGFKRFELFLDKPDKKLFPDYYVIIETPIGVKTIQSFLKKNKYAAVGDIARDFDLLVSNAKIYNEEGSIVISEAMALRELFLEGVQGLGLDCSGKAPTKSQSSPLRMTLPGALFK